MKTLCMHNSHCLLLEQCLPNHWSTNHKARIVTNVWVITALIVQVLTNWTVYCLPIIATTQYYCSHIWLPAKHLITLRFPPHILITHTHGNKTNKDYVLASSQPIQYLCGWYITHTAILHVKEENVRIACSSKIISVSKRMNDHHPDFHSADTNVWPGLFKLSFETVRDTKIQTLQYRILHRIMPYNKWFNNIKIKDSDSCDYCDGVDDIL